jgi:hypothetical protein
MESDMVTEKKVYYRAVLKIERIEVTPEVVGRSGYPADSKPAKRDETNLANLVIRNDSLEGLITKINAHANLIENVEAADDQKGNFELGGLKPRNT